MDARPEPPVHLGLRALAAVLLAAGVDLLAAVLGGYKLVRPLWELPRGLGGALRTAALDAALLALVVVPLLWVAALVARRRAERTVTVAAALLPLVGYLVLRDRLGAAWPVLAVAGLLGGLAVLEGRWRPADRRTWSLAAGGGAALIAAAIVVAARPPALIEPAGDPASAAVPSAERPNLLVVVLDTLRADHLGTYGASRPTSPWLDGFAADATVYERAVAPSSFTLPSHASLFTGLYPESHGATVDEHGVSLSNLGLEDDPTRVRPLADEARTLAEIARDAGLETGAVCANVAYLSRWFGLDQGFDTWAVPEGGWNGRRPAGLVLGRKLAARLLPARGDWWYRSRILGAARPYLFGSEVNRLALRWLESRRDRRFLLFLNYMDPHAPYMPVGEYRTLFAEADAPQNVDRAAIESGEREITEAERAPLVDAYDAEVRYLDDRLRELFATLEEWGLLEHTVVVLVGDHGESFGEHHEMEHATGLHEPQLHVPLILRAPRRTTGERVERFVSLVDVMPTLLDLGGLGRPEDLQGVSLLEPAAERPLPIAATLGPYMRDWSQRAVYDDPFKLIDTSRGDVELYDLRADPRERENLAARFPEHVERLTEQRAAFERVAVPRYAPLDVEQMDPDTRRRLEALGYVD
jgi:arylsulfatase A-like enzyme